MKHKTMSVSGSLHTSDIKTKCVINPYFSSYDGKNFNVYAFVEEKKVVYGK